MSETVTTSRGISVKLVGIPYLLDMLRIPNLDSERPYYEAKTKAGVVERHPHDWTTVQTQEEKRALADYEAKVAAANAKYDLDFTRLVLMRGVEVAMPTDDRWIKEQSFMGIVVPEDPIERRWHWIQTELIGNKEDVQTIILRVLELSDVSQEVLAAMADSFRHSLGQHDRHKTGGLTETTKPDGAGMVLQSTLRASEGGN